LNAAPEVVMHTYEERIKKIVLAYMPIVVLGAIGSFYYDVGAHPGSSASEDVVFRGTPLVPPLFLPIVLLIASRLSTRRDASGAISTALMGLVGLAFAAGSTLNFPNDLEAARAAGSPSGPRGSSPRSTCHSASPSRASPFLHSGSVACVRAPAALSTDGFIKAITAAHVECTDSRNGAETGPASL
jgi:hypothetical protein